MSHAICAVATVNGHSAIGVIRLSGARTHELLGKIFRAQNSKISNLSDYASRSIYGKIFWQDHLIDEVIVLIFSEAHSYTGEESAEIQAHGNPIILKNILKILYEVGFTPANPGEFTQRAYLAGKIDLTEAEAIKEIIEARSERQLQKALVQKEGFLKKRINQFRSDVLNITADLTAQLDFSDEGLEFATVNSFVKTLSGIARDIQSLIKNAKMNSIFKDGIEMVMLGAPNAGKSSLMNVLTGKNRSIVSATPGTTRDYIDAQMEISGVPVVLVDTAGIRKSGSDEIENLGMQKTLEKFLEADVRLMLIDASIAPAHNQFQELKVFLHPGNLEHNLHKSVLVLNKWDIADPEWKNHLSDENFWKKIFQEYELNDEMMFTKWQNNIIPVSAITMSGIDVLISKMEEIIENILPHNDSVNLAPWQVEIMEKIEKSITETTEFVSSGVNLEIVVENLNQILQLLSEITGQYNNEELLGRIFSRFCIGK